MTAAAVPAVGQIWSDNDPRSAGRQIRVLRIEGEHALVEAVTQIGGVPAGGRQRRTRIFVTRFVPTRTGYTLVNGVRQDAE